MNKQGILLLSLSSIAILGLGSYFFMSDYNRKRAFNNDTFGDPNGEVQMFQRRPPEYDGTFGGKRTKTNRKRHRKNNSKKN